MTKGDLRKLLEIMAGAEREMGMLEGGKAAGAPLDADPLRRRPDRDRQPVRDDEQAHYQPPRPWTPRKDSVLAAGG